MAAEFRIVRPRLARERDAAVATQRHYRAIADGFLGAVDAYFDDEVEQALASALAARDRNRALAALPDVANAFDERSRVAFKRMVDALVPPIAELVTDAANASAKRERFALSYALPEQLIAKARKKPRWAPTVVTVNLDWVRQRAARRVVEIGREQRDSLRRVLEKKFDERLRPAVVAKEIKRIVGLTSREAQAVENFRAQLIADGKKPARVEVETKRYSELQLQRRAERIARTEAVDAETAGKQEAWLDAASDGLLPGGAEKEWVASSDACPEICKPLDGMRVSIDGDFLLPDGRRVQGPSAHPHCECATVLRRGSP